MIQVSRSALRVTATDRELDALAAVFDRNHLIRVPNFFDADLGALIARRLERAQFNPRLDGDLVIEHTLGDGDLFAACRFVLNDPQLLEVIGRLCKCGSLGSFTGRIYSRSEPSKPGEQYYEWHSDVFEDRRVALSVNLGRVPYEGGMLQIRDAVSHRPIAEAANVAYLEALLIRVSDALEHRVAPVLGPIPRTVLAGWFRGDPAG